MPNMLPILAATLILTPTLAAQPPTTPGADLPDPGTTRLGAPEVRLPLDLSHRRPTIEATVDGHGPYRFVVDTGSPLTVIDAGIAAELALPVVGKQVLRSPGAPEGVRAKRVQAKRIVAGELTIEAPVLVTLDLVALSAGTIEGVLGRTHFRDLLLTLDYPRAELVAAAGTLPEDDPGVVPFDPTAGSIRIPATVAGQPLPMVLDTGSPGGFTLPKKLEDQLALSAGPAPGPTIQLVGAVHESWQATLDGAVELAGLRFESPEITLTTFADDFGNVGFEVLRGLRLTLDQQSGSVRLERPVAPPTARARTAGLGPNGGPVRIGGPAGKPRLGVAFEMTMAGFVKKDGGLVVRRVDPGSPAEQAGLAVGDIVLAVGGESLAKVEGVPAIARILRGPRPLALTVRRDGAERTIAVE